MQTLKNIIQVIIANISGYGVSIIIGFFLPLVLPIDDYGYYRQFILYAGYIYVLNVGFNDGIYKKYGGKEPLDIDKREINSEKNFIVFFHLLVSLFIFIIAIINNNNIWLLLAMSNFFTNTNSFYENIFVATGQFQHYSRIGMLNSFFYVVFLLIGIFVLKEKSYIFYIGLLLFINFLQFLSYEIVFSNLFDRKFVFTFNGKLPLFKKGLLLSLANLLYGSVSTVGNFIINNNFSIEIFAQYSFQASLVNVLLRIANAVGNVFYNLISKISGFDFIQKSKKILILISILLGAFYFPMKFLISIVLPEYNYAASMIAYTFISLPFLIISRVIISNLYRSKVPELHFFLESMLLAGVSSVLIYLGYKLTNSPEVIAILTSFSYFAWYFYCTEYKFKNLRNDKDDLSNLFSFLIIFWLCSSIFNTKIGFIIYILYTLIILKRSRDLLGPQVKKIIKFSKIG